MMESMKKRESWFNLITYYCYLLLIWGVFRLTVRLPLLQEELWFKPVIWGLPLLSIWFAERQRPKLFFGNLFKALGYGVGLGLMYMLVLFLVKITGSAGVMTNSLGGNDFVLTDVVGIGLATAIVEEMVFAGYIFTKIRTLFSSFWPAGFLTSMLFAGIHVPIGVFIYQYSSWQMAGFLLLVGIVSLGHYWVMERSKNVLGPIMSHWFWAIAVVMWG